jgi:DNA polymerase I-like protein with 3'-5' exonuclease and polymerase domains
MSDVCQECNRCNLHKYNEEVGSPQFIEPIYLNEPESAKEVLILMLDMPAMQQRTSLLLLRDELSKRVHRYRKMAVVVIHAIGCNVPKGTNIPKKSVSECSVYSSQGIGDMVGKYEKATILTFGSSSILSLKHQGFTFSDQKSTSVQYNRGVVHKKNEYKMRVLCTWAWNSRIKNSINWADIQDDISFLDRVLEGEVVEDKKPIAYRLIHNERNYKEFLKYLEEALDSSDTVPMSIDTETSSLYPFNPGFTVLMVQVSFQEDYGWVIPLEHPETPENIVDKNFKLVSRILKDKRIMKIGHNNQFDKSVLFSVFGKIWENWDWDTILMHHLVNPGRPHGLGYLGREFCPEYQDYDSDLEEYKTNNPLADPERGGTYANIPIRLLAKYGAGDVIITYRAFFELVKQLKEANLLKFYKNHVAKVSEQFLRMRINGIFIDTDKLKKMYYGWQKDMEEMYNDNIANHPAVLELEKSLPANAEYYEYQEDPDSWKEKNTSRLGKLKKKIPTRVPFNPGSNQQLAKIMRDFLGLPPILHTKTGASYNKDTREVYLMSYDPANPTKNPWGVDLSLLYWIDKYCMMCSSFDTFIKGYYLGEYISDRGKIHPSFNLAGTETGRVACDNPNVQNLPKATFGYKKKYKFKDLLVAPEGKIILMADYSQIELRVAASDSNDEAMLEDFRNGLDLHKSTAAFMFQTPLESVTTDQRSLAKTINFGLIYGQTVWAFATKFYQTFRGDESKAKKIYAEMEAAGFSNDMKWGSHRKLDIEIPDVFLQLAQAALDSYFKKHFRLAERMEEMINLAKKTGYVKSRMGRVRYLPLMKADPWTIKQESRKAINMPIQSAASDITQSAIIRLGDAIDSGYIPKAWGVRMFISVHDSIGFYVRIENALEAGKVIKEIMEDPTDLPWMKCPIKVDLEYGFRYGCLSSNIKAIEE